MALGEAATCPLTLSETATKPHSGQASERRLGEGGGGDGGRLPVRLHARAPSVRRHAPGRERRDRPLGDRGHDGCGLPSRPEERLPRAHPRRPAVGPICCTHVDLHSSASGDPSRFTACRAAMALLGPDCCLWRIPPRCMVKSKYCEADTSHFLLWSSVGDFPKFLHVPEPRRCRKRQLALRVCLFQPPPIAIMGVLYRVDDRGALCRWERMAIPRFWSVGLFGTSTDNVQPSPGSLRRGPCVRGIRRRLVLPAWRVEADLATALPGRPGLPVPKKTGFPDCRKDRVSKRCDFARSPDNTPCSHFFAHMRLLESNAEPSVSAEPRGVCLPARLSTPQLNFLAWWFDES